MDAVEQADFNEWKGKQKKKSPDQLMAKLKDVSVELAKLEAKFEKLSGSGTPDNEAMDALSKKLRKLFAQESYLTDLSPPMPTIASQGDEDGSMAYEDNVSPTLPPVRCPNSRDTGLTREYPSHYTKECGRHLNNPAHTAHATLLCVYSWASRRPGRRRRPRSSTT